MGFSSTDRLFHDLKIIAAQREGDRLYVADGQLNILHPSILGSLWRVARGDTRRQSVAAVSSCIDDALVLADFRVNAACLGEDLRKRGQARHLLDEIDRAAMGIRYMKVTYFDDLSSCITLDVLKERIASRLLMLRTRLGDVPSDVRSNDTGRAILYLTDGDFEELTIVDDR
jgi:hypothetical protein